jgi:type VI protein secretion system component Hcp
MDSAEIYLSLLRPGMGPSPVGAPVIGEAVCNGFEGQIEISTWDWKLHTPEEARDTGGGSGGGTPGAAPGATPGAISTTSKVNAAQSRANQKVSSLTREMTELTSKAKWDALAPGVRERKIRDFFEKQAKQEVNAVRDEAQAGVAGGIGGGEQAGGGQSNRNYEFNFSKRVDLATTQMLNSMKAGDVFPTGVMTVHQRSSNAGLSLVITVQKLRLIDYTLKVDMTETMTDMTEQWTARFEALAYVYKNRRTIDKTEDIGQAAAKVASQGTVRVFTMKNIGLPF